MHDFIPQSVTPSNAFRVWCNKITDWMRRNEIKSSTDILINQTSHGTTLTVSDRIKQKWSQGGGGTTAAPSTNWNWRGTFILSPPTPYMTFDVVQTTSGNFQSTIDNNPNR